MHGGARTANTNLIKLQSNEPPKTERTGTGFELLGRRLSEMAAHLDDLSNLLYENQDLSNVIMGAGILLGTYATELADSAKILNPETSKGGAE
jgi:hypothetical protein